ncbi:RNA polymerase sigma-70 factor (ECF subfamily) [Mucilaginibacter frigoritolerans]|jgi:RNA polymerase sigma factor (sigma-70 family)|uniref:RNA polymerase sigma-70 factor (ECF subfamily) n=1 Tax=Mucilaginibacter frigoritolerans TaxID=652788 RepID=A0A562U9M9_9SPHI|nr:sigma-70 family RNA polymerase sigma factor [Mucilaginibacter frigoritolerans]TWJ02229.1 RNA polymerase sigma-70 factor (ECF subfamily) [Mucilaginibacter frigoritolerans]
MQQQAQKDQFIYLIQQNKKLIFKVCNAYCHNPEDRKDLVQEIIIHLWQSFHKYDNRFKLSTWMYRIAINTAISHYRASSKKQKVTVSIHDSLIDIADETNVELDENIKLLYHFINQFNDLNKALMILYLDNNSYKDIAEILGISETNVATKVNRLKLQLKQQFKKL